MPAYVGIMGSEFNFRMNIHCAYAMEGMKDYLVDTIKGAGNLLFKPWDLNSSSTTKPFFAPTSYQWGNQTYDFSSSFLKQGYNLGYNYAGPLAEMAVTSWITGKVFGIGMKSLESDLLSIKNNIAFSKKRPFTEAYFAGKNYSELKLILSKKFGPSRGGAPGGFSFYNPKTKRSFHIHHHIDHRQGRPHVDIRRRGIAKEETYYLKDD